MSPPSTHEHCFIGDVLLLFAHPPSIIDLSPHNSFNKPPLTIPSFFDAAVALLNARLVTIGQAPFGVEQSLDWNSLLDLTTRPHHRTTTPRASLLEPYYRQ
jgi:hypothetical protein